MKERSILTVSSVLRSQCVEWGEMPRVWERRVLLIKGTFGRKTFARARGEEVSIVDGCR